MKIPARTHASIESEVNFANYTLVIIPRRSRHFYDNVDQGSSLCDLPMEAGGRSGDRHLTQIQPKVPHRAEAGAQSKWRNKRVNESSYKLFWLINQLAPLLLYGLASMVHNTKRFSKRDHTKKTHQ
jgi:hypothetical protein